jgi:hypothetical protein
MNDPQYAEARARVAAQRAAKAKPAGGDGTSDVDRRIAAMQASGDHVLFHDEYKRLLDERRMTVAQREIAPVMRADNLEDFERAHRDLMERSPFITHDPAIRSDLQARRAELTAHETTRFQEATGEAMTSLGSATRMQDVDAAVNSIPKKYRGHADVQRAVTGARDRITQIDAEDTIGNLVTDGATSWPEAQKLLEQWTRNAEARTGTRRWRGTAAERRRIQSYFLHREAPKPDALAGLAGGAHAPAAGGAENPDAVLNP